MLVLSQTYEGHENHCIFCHRTDIQIFWLWIKFLMCWQEDFAKIYGKLTLVNIAFLELAWLSDGNVRDKNIKFEIDTEPVSCKKKYKQENLAIFKSHENPWDS